MRTALFLLAGFLLLGANGVLAKLFSANYPAASGVATAIYLVLWLAIAGFNMWVGVARAGYSVTEELPIFLLLFGVPALAAILRWKLLYRKADYDNNRARCAAGFDRSGRSG